MKLSRIFILPLIIILLFSVVVPIPRASVSAPFDLSKVKYYEHVKEVLSLTEQQETALTKYGFVVVEPKPRYKQFEQLYLRLIYVNDLPVFVTTDSMLHLFHIVFDCSLKIIEKNYLYPMIHNLTESMLNKCLKDYQSCPKDGSLTYWAIRNATVYFAVANSLITGKVTYVPSDLSSDLSYYLDHILEKLDFFPACVRLNSSDTIFYDFSQFKVRGHYLGDPELEQYFRCMMWYGNYPVFIPRINETYLWGRDVRHIDTLSVVYMRDLIRSDEKDFATWGLAYNVTSCFVGESDSINFLNLEKALSNVFGEEDKYLPLAVTPDGLYSLRAELSKPEYQQQILSQGCLKDVSQAYIQMTYPIIFQFMGQRYIPDSYMFQHLTYDKVLFNSTGMIRILPNGLDLMAVIGSKRARQLLQPDFDFQLYERNLDNLTKFFADLNDTTWLKSSYTAWIYALSSLVNVTHSSDYPEFMQTVAWLDEKLNTALGSWAQLRHDTILYAKQTYIPGYICGYPEAFVEPYPIFYSRLKRLCDRTFAAVNALNVGTYDIPMYCVTSSLNTIQEAADKLKVISEKELSKEPLTPSEVDFIKRIAYLETGCGPVEAGWYVNTIGFITSFANITSEAACIADVATFSGTILPKPIPPKVLHVGTGYVDAVVVLYPDLNGTLVASVGPVFSYYEFALDGVWGEQLPRLNDDEWKEMLETENVTNLHPYWVLDIYGIIDPLYLPEFLNAITVMLFASVLLAVFSTFTKKFWKRQKPQNLGK